jgi:hypothetical protein
VRVVSEKLQTASGNGMKNSAHFSLSLALIAHQSHSHRPKETQQQQKKEKNA